MNHSEFVCYSQKFPNNFDGDNQKESFHKQKQVNNIFYERDTEKIMKSIFQSKKDMNNQYIKKSESNLQNHVKQIRVRSSTPSPQKIYKQRTLDFSPQYTFIEHKFPLMKDEIILKSQQQQPKQLNGYELHLYKNQQKKKQKFEDYHEKWSPSKTKRSLELSSQKKQKLDFQIQQNLQNKIQQNIDQPRQFSSQGFSVKQYQRKKYLSNYQKIIQPSKTLKIIELKLNF